MKEQEIRDFLLLRGASDVGFTPIPDGDFNDCRYAVSVVVRLSEAVVTEIGSEPTYTYFHHYRTVNAHIDRMLLELGLALQTHGYKYIPVAASQSTNTPYKGRCSHKKAARLAGLGWIGKNNLFFHKDFGSAVRLGTLMTDCPLSPQSPVMEPQCGNCTMCVDACPCNAISGVPWSENNAPDAMFLPERCSKYMKEQFGHIGRGAVCGICMRVCPKNTPKNRPAENS